MNYKLYITIALMVVFYVFRSGFHNFYNNIGIVEYLSFVLSTYSLLTISNILLKSKRKLYKKY